MTNEQEATVSCYSCCTSSIAICVSCMRHYCWNHFCQHRQTYEKYVDDAREDQQLLSKCLIEFQPIECRLYSTIDNWERETIEEIHRSATNARRTLEAHIKSYRSHFDEESSNIIKTLANNRDALLTRLEKLQIEYEFSLNNLHLIRHYDRSPMLEIGVKQSTREEIRVDGSSQIGPHESDVYVPQTALGDRLIKEPLVEIAVGSYWAMGGSDKYLLLQEYEKKQLTLFDKNGTRGISMTWHFDTVIRDIQWSDDLRQFFILLDRKMILFDPATKHYQEIGQIIPYQGNAFRRCTCQHNRLFIAYWGLESVIELIEISSWISQQRWWSPVTCHANELITCIRLSTNDQLALSIQDENNPLNRRFRFEIRDITLNILHTLPLFVDSGIFSRMTSLPDGHWVVLNVDENLVFMINAEGELIDKIDIPRGPLNNITLVGENMVVIRAANKIFFYDVEFSGQGKRH